MPGNPKAASYFINFLCRPDIALRNMDATGYGAPFTPEILEGKQTQRWIITRFDLLLWSEADSAD